MGSDSDVQLLNQTSESEHFTLKNFIIQNQHICIEAELTASIRL